MVIRFNCVQTVTRIVQDNIMDIKIKGNVDGLSDQQLDFLKHKIKENNIKGKDVTISVLGQAGDNFASALKVITIKNEKEDFRMIAKITQNVARVMNEMNFMSQFMFTNEITIYTEVMPLMDKIQKKAGIEPENMFPYPMCYGASNDTPHEIILLQDLMTEKYVMMDKFKPLPSDTIKLMLRTLAQYHALNFVLKENYPEEFAEFSKKMVNMTTADQFLSHAETFKLVGHQLSAIFEDKQTKNIIIDTINKQIDTCLELEKSDKGSKYSVLVHGDCWTNNFLFQLQDDKPSKCIMIDYQLVREASPVNDILHLILNCTDYETRSKHYQEWLDYYYSQLGNYLSVHGLEVTNTYPKDKFESDLHRYSGVSLGLALFTASLIMRKDDEIAKAKEVMVESESMENFQDNFKMGDLHMETITKIKKRIGEVISSCIDFGYLNVNDYV